MIRARLAPRNTLLIGLVTLAVTFAASRGNHSAVHELVALVAMILEAALVTFSVLGRRRAAVILLVAVAICWLTAFVTDSFYLNTYRNFQYLLANGEWIGGR